LALSIASLATPHAPAAVSADKLRRSHVVYTGQTLGMIAKRYNVSIAAICAANGIKRNRPIHPGQKLVIPQRPASRSAAKKQTRRTRKQASRRGARTGKPGDKGYVILEGRVSRWRGFAVLRNGSIPAAARDGFERALASWRTGKTERIHGRLIRMISKVSDHFDGRPIEIISGFRPPSREQYTLRSKHNMGRAIDFRIRGVSNEETRDFCRTLPRVGVGYYPNSSFVHLDIREYSAYWVDASGPGQAPRYVKSPRGRKASTARRTARKEVRGSAGRTSAARRSASRKTGGS
jgi:LysM repeat protein